jgi:hypothetical protein
MGNLTRDQILARKLGRDIVELPDGGTVEVRGLNREEAIQVGEVEAGLERDALLISLGMVDPVMGVADVKTWGQGDTSGTLEVVSLRIGQLSHMVEGAGKSGVSRPGRRSRS